MADVISALAPAPATIEQLVDEGLISMGAAARMYGSSRPGKPTHKSTCGRHALAGIKLPGGRVLKLEAIRVNGRLMTSRAAVLRFLAAQQDPAPSTAEPVNPPRSPARRSRAHAEAAADLDALGIK